VIDWQKMVRLMALSRFLFAATALAAALLAPSAAQAHAGHSHGPVKVERSVPPPQASSSVRVQGPQKTDVHDAQRTTWIAASSLPQGEGMVSCAGGCCHSAGHGCCAATLPALNTVALPPTDPERLLARFLWGPGVTPGVLPEPPRYLV
jgi:hypothetical protein